MQSNVNYVYQNKMEFSRIQHIHQWNFHSNHLIEFSSTTKPYKSCVCIEFNQLQKVENFFLRISRNDLPFWFTLRNQTNYSILALCASFSIFTHFHRFFPRKKYPCICCKFKQLENFISYHIFLHAHKHTKEKETKFSERKVSAANQNRMRSVHCKW